MMIKKFFTLTLILCAAFSFFTAKSFAAEFELVSYSSHVKLQWLATTGMPEAQKILNEIGKANIFGKRNLVDYARLEMVNSIYQEMTYLATVQYVQQNNYKNIFDLGGGYSPRAIVFSREGRKYFNGELMAVAVTADRIMKKIIEPQYHKNFVYDEVLVEDKDAYLRAIQNFDGKVCFVEQGLMIYLNEDRLISMCENIRDVLKKNGGCYITSDLSTRELFKDIAAALYGEDQTKLIYDETKDMYEELFDSLLNEETFDYQLETIEYAEKELGFKIKQVPLLTDSSKLNCLKKLSPAQAEKIKKIAEKKYLWVITVD